MPRASAASTRDRILDVTADLMRSVGLATLTTREIARAAGLTEAALYRHFKSKEDLITRVLAERLPVFIELLKDLPQRVGDNTVADNLRRVAEAAVPFYRQAMPMLAAMFGDPNLLVRHRVWMQQKELGPQRANLALASYLQGEIDLGRVAANLNAEAAAAMLLGACQQRAFFDEFMGREVDSVEMGAFAASIIETLMAAAEPRPRKV